MVKQFEKKHPNLAVDVIKTTYPRAKETLANLIASGNAPDIAQIVSHWTSYFATTGAFEPLGNFLPENHLALRPHIQDMEGGVYRDELYSVAWGYAPLSLIMNKNILRKAGFSELPSPLTLGGFSEVCTGIQKSLGSEGVKPYAISTSREEADFLRLYPFLQAFGGRLIDDDDKVVLDSEENIRAFGWLRSLHENHDLFFGDIYSIRQAFAEGKIAFITEGPWIKLWLEELTGCSFEENFEVILNPVYTGSNSISWNYNHALAICSQSSNKIYAGEFIDSITMDPEIAGRYYRQVGQLPITEKDIEAISSEEPFFRNFAEQLKGSQCLRSENAMFEKALEFCIDAVHKIVFEGADIRRELMEKEYYLNILYR
jgi:ABC-type glycerol-3-phosphate transport system substrate-binding protein